MIDIKPCNAIVGAKVRMLREVLGKTQLELANMTSFSRPSIANIELGKQRLLLEDIELFATAHKYIIDHWVDLKEGDVVDVEFILGEASEKKISQRL